MGGPLGNRRHLTRHTYVVSLFLYFLLIQSHKIYETMARKKHNRPGLLFKTWSSKSKKVLEMSRTALNVLFVKLKVWFGYQLVHCRLTMALFQLLTAIITNSFHAVKIFSYFRKMLFQRRKAIFSTMIVVWMAEATDLIDVFIILILTLITNISDIIIINKHCLSLTLTRVS